MSRVYAGLDYGRVHRVGFSRMLFVVWKQRGVGRVGMFPRRLLLNQIVPHHIEFDMGGTFTEKYFRLAPS